MQRNPKQVKLVPAFLLEAFATNTLDPSAARLLAAVLLEDTAPGQYTGSIEKLATALQVPFKQAYSWLKKAELAGLIAVESMPYDEVMEKECRKITVLPPSSWQT